MNEFCLPGSNLGPHFSSQPRDSYRYHFFFHHHWKVFYGQKPPSRESTTTECGFNYQLLAVIYWSSPMGTPSCSQPQLATDNGVRDGRSNWLVAPTTLHRAVPLSSTYCTLQCRLGCKNWGFGNLNATEGSTNSHLQAIAKMSKLISKRTKSL